MNSTILTSWPREGMASRGPRPIFTEYFDGQIHALEMPARYKSMRSFRGAIVTAAYYQGKKLETCTDAEKYPGMLIVRVSGEIE